MSRGYGAEDLVELTDDMQAQDTICRMPTISKKGNYVEWVCIYIKGITLTHNSFSTKETSLSVTSDYQEERNKVVKLSAAEIKKYEAQFAQSVVRFSNIQLNVCIGKGITLQLEPSNKQTSGLLTCRCIW